MYFDDKRHCFYFRKLASDEKVIKDPLLAALAAREAANRNGKMTVSCYNTETDK